MHDFVLKEIINADIASELEQIGFDGSYIHTAADKYRYRNVKIYGLTLPQANILKQTALSVGADCALHRDVLVNKIEKTDVILGGSQAQLGKISEKLQHQQFGLAILSSRIYSGISETPQQVRGDTRIVGILNLTDNSFSDGYPDFESAKKRLEELADADIIDIGAESTRPGFTDVPAKQQLEKLLPILEHISHSISIDTRSAEVARECIKAGAGVINDVSGLAHDPEMAGVIAETGVKVIIGSYASTMDEIYLQLHNTIKSCGIAKENIIVDPGIGFGKTRAQNFEIIRRVEEFYGLGCPVMLGVSRKSLLGMPDADNATKDIFTVALHAYAPKVDYIRVHNVKLHRQLLDMFMVE
jgi:dihydropteroate synthase